MYVVAILTIMLTCFMLHCYDITIFSLSLSLSLSLLSLSHTHTHTHSYITLHHLSFSKNNLKFGSLTHIYVKRIRYVFRPAASNAVFDWSVMRV